MPALLDDSLVIVLAGGAGERLSPLTKERAKPAVYFGGPYRIIDFSLSNCINSGLRRIYIATQYKSLSLNRHIRMGWNVVSEELGEFIEILPPQKRVGEHWYQGTADAVYQNLYSIIRENPRHVIVLSGDHVYKMDYSRMLRFHQERGAAATLAAIEVPLHEATQFGVVAIDEQERITGFQEKPAQPSPIPGSPDVALASMGVYIFDTDVLVKALEEDAGQPTKHDFGKDIIPAAVRNGRAAAHPFDLSAVGTRLNEEPYWRDVGTIDAYWDANIDLTATDPLLNLYDTRWPIWTYQPQLPPAKFVHNQDDRRGMAIESMVSGGCIVSGQVFRSVLFSSVRVHSYASVNWAVLLPGVQVGRGARLTRVVVDRGCSIPDGMVIGEDAAADAERFYRSDNGITLVTREMLGQLEDH